MTLAQATSQSAGGATRAMAGPYRVVIIEEVAVARALGRLLEMLGQQVETANDGRSGIELVRATRPDVVFTRIVLPDMDGFQVARAIRSGGGKRPVLVAHTGYGRSEVAKEAKEAGFDLLVTKPVSIEQLRGALSFVAGETDCGGILL
jgi:CheY-like chemotaxis protein